jgi:chromosome segregation ATPase
MSDAALFEENHPESPGSELNAAPDTGDASLTAADAPNGSPDQVTKGVNGTGGQAAHETLLVRHGLISHIASLPPATPLSEARQFRADASRVARNVIPLSETRFGLLLPTDRTLVVSELPHDLHEVFAAPKEVPVSENTVSDPAPGAVASVFHDNGSPDRNQQADPPPPALAPSQSETGRDIEPRLSAIEARLSEFSVDAIAAHLEARLDTLLSGRLETFSEALPGQREPQQQDVAEEGIHGSERARDFWTGMEQALRLLLDTAGRFEASAATRETSTEDAAAQYGASLREAADVLAASLAGLEDAVSLGFEAADSSRENQQARFETRLEQIDLRIAETTRGISSLAEGIEELRHGQPTIDMLRSAFAEQLAPISQDIAGAHSTMRQIADMLAAALSQLDKRLEDTSSGIGAVIGMVEGKRNDESMFPQLIERIDALGVSLVERGGVLSSALETSKRSMKNFWLASEDVLRRIDDALERLQALAEMPAERTVSELPEETVRQLEAVEAGVTDAASSLTELSQRQSDLMERQAALDSGTRQLRQALAELLARDLRDYGLRPQADPGRGLGAPDGS